MSASFSHTYTINDYKYDIVDGDKVIVAIWYTVTSTRTNPSGSCTLEKQINFSRDSKNWIIPRTIDNADSVASLTPQARTDYTNFDDLTIPDDLITWLEGIYNNDATRLDNLNWEANNKIGD